PVTIKLKREMTGQFVEVEACETRVDKERKVSNTSKEKTDIENRGQNLWYMLILITILAVCIAKLVKK
ncbi:MAG: hypothetical protein K2O43_00065, partial [Muribaculaceae bacterium]|nr:hypothetical protein [Muribaculaceae bacterium]